MTNTMQEASDSECAGDKESPNECEIRSHDEYESDCESPAGLSSGGNGQPQAGLHVPEVYSVRREYDYIRFSDVASSSRSQATKKSDEEDLAKLGPKTKETELRLGLPEDGSDVAGSKRRPDSLKTSESSLGLTVNGLLEGGSRDSTINCGGGSIYGLQHQQHQFREGIFMAGSESQARGFPIPKQDLDYAPKEIELNRRPMFQEFRAMDLPFSNGQKPWQKPFRSAGPTEISENSRASVAKRAFSDTMEAAQESEPKVLLNSQQLLKAPPMFMFPFAGGPDPWQMKWEPTTPQSKANFGNFCGRMGANNIQPLTPKKRNDGLGEGSSSAAQSAVKASTAPVIPALTLVSPEKKQNPVESEAARNGNRAPPEPRAAPVVGWPPVHRSFRRNFPSQPKPADNAAPPPAAAAAAPAPGPTIGQQKQSQTSRFVKVNVEGVPIGRKIDLKAYGSYQKLTVALDEMFRGSIPAQKSGAENSSQPFLLSDREYVLVYEDDEGDRMLVGDVPWEMFVGTVKRLRVIKSSDARALATSSRQLLKTSE